MKKTGSNENSFSSGVIRPSTNVQGGNRRALSAIDENILGHPCAVVQKRGKNIGAGRVTRRFASQFAGKEKSLVEDDEIVDIDSPDKKNPLAVVEYMDDLYAYYKNTEAFSCQVPDYMCNQVDINQRMRAKLIDWLIEVHYKLELMDEALYLTVNIIDRFLAVVHSVVRQKLQLVGVTALLLACKYEGSVLVVDKLIQTCDGAYCRQELIDMERLIVNTLQFKLSLPTPYVFMRRFLKAAQSDKQLELLSYFLMELCLVEYEMLRFAPSLLAAAAIYTAQCSITGSKKWSKTCEKYTCYTQDQLKECAKLIAGFHDKAGSGKLTGVHNKYSTSKFRYVAAKAKPAAFLIYD